MTTIIPVEVYNVPLANEIDVTTRKGLFHIAKVLNKPVLSLSGAKLTRMGLEGEHTYDALCVVDGAITYLYGERVKESKNAEKE